MATISLSVKVGKWVLFGNRESRQAIAVLYPSATTAEKLRKNGFELIWDSAKTKQIAYTYAETNAVGSLPGDHTGIGFYQYPCRGCDLFIPVHLFVGTIHQETNQRNIGFYGRLCDHCVANERTFKVSPVCLKATPR